MSAPYTVAPLENKVFPWALRNAQGKLTAKFPDLADAEKVRDLLNAGPVQQYQMMIVGKPAKPRGKPVATTYAIAAKSRDEAIALFDAEIGAHHRELALNWACSESLCCVLRTA